MFDSIGVIYHEPNFDHSGEFGIHFNDAEDLDSKAVVPYVSGFAAAGSGGTVSCVGFQYSDGTQLFHGDLTDCNSNGLFYLQNAQEVVTSVDVLTYEIDRSCGSGTNWQTFVRQIRIQTLLSNFSYSPRSTKTTLPLPVWVTRRVRYDAYT